MNMLTNGFWILYNTNNKSSSYQQSIPNLYQVPC